jgi:hypothetical protein
MIILIMCLHINFYMESEGERLSLLNQNLMIQTFVDVEVRS